MNGTIKNLLVGVFILSSIAIFVATIMFLKPKVGDGKTTIYVRFSDIGNIKEGTRVLFAGKPIGEVIKIDEIENARDLPTDGLGRIYFYQLTLHIDSKAHIYNTDEISIQTSGLLGEKSIGINPKAPPKGVTPKLVSEQPIYADSVDSIQNALIEFSELASSMEEAFKGIAGWVKGHGEEVAATVKAAGSALNQVDLAMKQMDDLQAFKNLGSIMESLKSTSQTVDLVTKQISQGKGTVGKLLADNDLYLQANGIMTKANNLMNDVNHYGVLFHLNKQWQRSRLQKITELNALETPQGFRTYFQREVDDINTSMARISMLINKAEGSTEKEQIFRDVHFKRDFAELMRRSDELSDNLRLYNQQLNAALGE